MAQNPTVVKNQKSESKICVATAILTETKNWNLKLNPNEIREFNRVSQLETFVEAQFANVRPTSDELVLFIGARVTDDDFLVVGRDKVPERNLLDSVFRLSEEEMRRGLARHVFFFTDRYDETNLSGAVIDPNDSNFDSVIMQGVTLYRLTRRGGEIPVENIKNVCETSSPTALDLYKELNRTLNLDVTNPEMLVSMVPSGSRSHEPVNVTNSNENGTVDYALCFVSRYNPISKDCTTEKEMEADERCVEEIRKKLNDTELIKLNSKFEELRTSEPETSKDTLMKCMERVAKILSERKKELKDSGRSLGKIWLLVSAHGDEKKGILLSQSESISLKGLTAPLFAKPLEDTTKVLVISCCKGSLPKLGQSAQAGISCDAKYGLMFRNRPGEDVWSTRGLKKCVTLFGSVPGFAAYRPEEYEETEETRRKVDAGHPNILFKAMEIAAANLESHVDLFDFVQRVQGCFDDAWSECTAKARSGPGDGDHQSREVDDSNVSIRMSRLTFPPTIHEFGSTATPADIVCSVASLVIRQRRTSEILVSQKQNPEVDQAHLVVERAQQEGVSPKKARRN